MGKKWILGVALLVVFLGGLFFMGYIPGTESDKADMDLTFYDEEGNELGKTTTKLAILGIQTPGFEGDVHSVKVAVSFIVTTTMEYLEMRTNCYLEVVTRINTQTAGIVYTVAEHQVGTSKLGLENTFEATYLMSSLLPDSAITETGKTNGWVMSFNARVKTIVDLEDGTQRDVEDSCSIDLTLTWFEHEFSVDSWFVPPVIG